MRWLVASLLVVALALAAHALLRVDFNLGAPAGPDRLIEAIDIQVRPGPLDIARARSILQVRPDDGRAYRVLASKAVVDGDAERARALYAIAVRRSPRDRPTREALSDVAFAAGNVEAGFDQLDVLFRVAPTLREPLLHLVIPYLGDDRVQAALVSRLAGDPPWRAAIVPMLLDPSAPPSAALGLLERLSRRTQLSAGEADARITLLRRSGQDEEARQLWLAGISVTSHGDDALLFDGGFEHPEVTGEYGWRAAPPPGVAILSDGDDPAEGLQALAIDFSGRAIQSPGLTQNLALGPGAYRFSFAVDNATDAQRPFAWRLSCNHPHEPLLSMPLAAAAAHGWINLQARFTVPVGCPGQTLHLDFLARSIAEQQLSGRLRLDAIHISRH